MNPTTLVYIACLTAGVHAPVSPTSQFAPAYAYATVMQVSPQTVVLQVSGESAINRRWTCWAYKDGPGGIPVTVKYTDAVGIDASMNTLVYLCNSSPVHLQIICRDDKGKILASNEAMALKGY